MRATALQTPGSVEKEGERRGHAGVGFWQDLWKGPMLEQGRSVRICLHEEKGAAETTCDGQTTDPILWLLLRGRGREFRSEVKPGKKGEMGGK